VLCKRPIQVRVGVAGNGLLLVCRFRAAQSRPASARRRNSEILDPQPLLDFNATGMFGGALGVVVSLIRLPSERE